METIIIDIFIRLLQVFSIYIFFKNSFRQKYNFGICISMLIVFEFIRFITEVVWQVPIVNGLKLIIGTGLYSFIVCEGKVTKKITNTLFFAFIILITELITIVVFDAFGIMRIETIDYVQNQATNFRLLVQTVLEFTAIQMISLKKETQKNGEVYSKEWIIIFFQSVMCMLAVFILGMEIVTSVRYTIYHIVLIGCIVVIDVTSCYFYRVMEEKASIERENKIYKAQVELYKEWNNNNEAIRHDIKNYLAALNVVDGQVQKYVKSLKEKIENEKVVRTGNVITDSIINFKVLSAKNEKIEIQTNIELPSEISKIIDEMDMVILLGNLLDNAIEASRKIEEEDRKICVTLIYSMGNIICSVKNKYSGEYDGETKFKTTKADKKSHGIGLSNIRKIVEKHKGDMIVKAENGEFCVDIVLYIVRE